MAHAGLTLSEGVQVATTPIHERVVCSSISFRQRTLPEALDVIGSLGFREIDLGALPGVCDHVPADLSPESADSVAAVLEGQSIGVTSVNAEVGVMNQPLDAAGHVARVHHLELLVELCHRVGSPAIVLPNGSHGHEPIADLETDLDVSAAALREAANVITSAGLQLWVEAQHFGRIAWSTERAGALIDRLEGSGIGIVFDLAHVVAAGDDPGAFAERFGDRISHVHLRDAVAGDFHYSIGNGEVNFDATLAALERGGYRGRYSLELETQDVTDDQRPTAAWAAAERITSILTTLEQTA